MSKTRLTISLDQDLADFIKVYAQENRTTVAAVITQFILTLKRQVQGQGTEVILSDPDFHKALQNVQSTLRKGTAKWYSFEEIFDTPFEPVPKKNLSSPLDVPSIKANITTQEIVDIVREGREI